MKVDKKIYIEDLVREVPGSVSYLMKKGLKCLACGEPVWGTLEDAAKEKGFSDQEIEHFAADLNRITRRK
ncbi:MAG: DUF1858 domain-containing protein [bacterium]